MSFRGYFEVEGPDASGLAEQVVRQRQRVLDRLSGVGRVVAVVSGKGGVGKSWVTAAIARELARRGASVGVVDADLQSPTIALMLGAKGPLRVSGGAVAPALGAHDVRVISTGLLLEDGSPLAWRSDPGESHVWRGAAEAAVLREFLSDVGWGTLDVLLVDMPPDAARLLDLASLVRLRFAALAVTIPSDESAHSVRRALGAARAAGVPLVGVVENMSGYFCGRCLTTGPLFDGDAGARLAEAFGAPLLARIPFVPRGAVAPPLPDALLAAVCARFAANAATP